MIMRNPNVEISVNDILYNEYNDSAASIWLHQSSLNNCLYEYTDYNSTEYSSCAKETHYMISCLRQMVISAEKIKTADDKYLINMYKNVVTFFNKSENNQWFLTVLDNIEKYSPRGGEIIDNFLSLWYRLKKLILEEPLEKGNNENMENCSIDTVLRSNQHEKLLTKRSEYYKLISAGSSEDKEVPLTVNKNYVEWFLKYFVIGKSIYKKLSDFNEMITRKIQEDNFLNNKLVDPKDILFLTGRNATFLMNIFGISIEGFDINDDVTHSLFKPKIQHFIPSVNKFPVFISSDKFFILKDNKIDPETSNVSFKTEKQYNEYIFEILTFKFRLYDARSGYIEFDIPDLRRLCVSVCNYTDSSDNRHQYITISTDSYDNRYDISYNPETLIFYHIPDNVDFLFHTNENIEDPHHFNFINDYSYYPNILKPNGDINLISQNNCIAKKIRIFRVDKPIFDDDQIDTFRALDWIYRRSKIEQSYCNNYSSDGSPTRRKLQSEFNLKYKDQYTSNDLDREFYEKYPQFKYGFIDQYKEKEIQNDLRTQWYQQLFIKCVNESLYRIINDIPNNKFGEQIFKNGFISSRDSMLQHFISNTRDYKDIDIMNTNFDFMMNHILYQIKRRIEEK